jgi:hypothetical protein
LDSNLDNSQVKFRTFDLTRMQSWVESLLHNDPKTILNLNWVGLLETLGTKVNGSTLSDAEQWESCAQQVCSLLLLSFPDWEYSIKTKSLLLQISILRAYKKAQAAYAQREEKIIHWLFDEIIEPYEQVENKAKNWTTLDFEGNIEEIRYLRYLKNILGIVSSIVDSAESHQKLDRWISLRPMLP